MALNTVRMAAVLSSGRSAKAPLSGFASLLGVLPGKGVGEGEGVDVGEDGVGVDVGEDGVGVGDGAEAVCDGVDV
jgi:hypothetical protein